MMTVIVPTDFSAVANNAALYAAQMLTGHYDTQLMLYHMYEKESEAAAAEEQLQRLKEELTHTAIAKIETRCEIGSSFIGNLERLARHTAAHLVVMGITGKSRIEQVFLGSNTLKMVERNVCPVMIIPPSAQFTQIKNVAMTSDFKQVETTIPVVPIKNVLKRFLPSLHIVNVNSDHYVSLTDAYLKERSRLMEMFEDLNPEFYFIGTYDLHDTITQFVTDKNIDVLVTVPRNRSLFSNLFKGSNTKKMAYESAIPILAAHE